MVENIHILGDVGHFTIKGEIGSYEDEMGNVVKNVDLEDVVAAVRQLRNLGAKSFEIIVDGPGGFCDVGFNIYDFLTTIPEQVKTIAENMCASIDTVIWFSGSIREAKCPLMIHNPWMAGVKGDSDEIQQAADDLLAEEEKIISFYSKHTSLEKIALDALMKKESYIYPDMAFKLGFSTVAPTEKVTTPVNYKAVAKINDNMSKENKVILSKMDSVLSTLKEFMTGQKVVKPKALSVVEQGGKTLEITNADGTDITGAPIVGNMVTLDGAPAEGEFVLTDMNVTISVTAGTITAVTDIPMDANKQLADALKLIEDLKAENSTAKTELETSKKDVEAMTAKLTEIETTLSTMKGKVEIPLAQNSFRKASEPTGLLANLDEKREELRKKREELNKK